MTEKDKLIRKEFPILKNRNVIYLDNAATSQKPPCVIEAANQYYSMHNANPLRGLYELSVDATDAYENARKTVADFIGAARPEEIVFTRNASESLNLIAYSYARTFLKEGDEIICTIAEHHSNMLPWQQAAKATGAKLTYLYCEKDGTLTPEMLEEIISEKTKLVAVTQISNFLWMCRIWIVILWLFPVIRCLPPWESVLCMPSMTFWRRCLRSSLAVR